MDDFDVTSASTITVTGSPQAIAVADINDDDHVDFITINFEEDDVKTFLGDGSGNFTFGKSFPVGVQPIEVALFDMNDDGILDIISLNEGNNNVSILIGEGNGNFVESSLESIHVDSDPRGLYVGDVTGDDLPNIITTSKLPSPKGAGVFRRIVIRAIHLRPEGRSVLGRTM